MGRVPLIRGEIRWYSGFPTNAARFLVLARNEVIDLLNEIVVAPVTRAIRGLLSEILPD